MNVKQEPLDMHERFKTETNLDSGERNCLRFKNEYYDEVICESQTKKLSVDDVEIKCEVPKIEQLADLPLKFDNESVAENFNIFSTIKKELDSTNDFHEVKTTDLFVDIRDIKHDISEHVQVKYENEVLTMHCDLPTLKDEGTDFTDYFAQPCNSKQVERGLQLLKNKIPKVCKKRRLYPCPVCQKNLHSSKSRSEHTDRHFDKRCVVCKFCGKFMNRFEFLWHYFVHVVPNRTRNESPTSIKVSKLESFSMNYIQPKSNVKPVNYDFPSKRLKRNHNFNTSYSKLQDEKPFKCDICAKEFNRKAVLQQHLLIHTNDRSFKCHICYKQFKRSSHLQRHLISHTNEKPFECDVCFKLFKHKRGLQQHSIMHTNEKSFKCDICFKTFYLKSTLHRHLKIHSDQKPFKCDICCKEFYRKEILQQHLIVHTNDKSFQCDICSKQFKRKGCLQNHLRIHSNEKPFKCDICSKGFSQTSTLRHHLLIHSSKKAFKCDICSKEFSRKSTLQKHLTIHPNGKLVLWIN